METHVIFTFSRYKFAKESQGLLVVLLQIGRYPFSLFALFGPLSDLRCYIRICNCIRIRTYGSITMCLHAIRVVVTLVFAYHI